MLTPFFRRIASLFVWLLIFFGAQNAFGQFVTIWQTDLPGGVSANDQLFMNHTVGFNYTVNWVDVNNAGSFGTVNVNTPKFITFPAPGTYKLTITGTYPRPLVGFGGDAPKLLSVEQWGTNHWTSMQQAFQGCTNMVINATDVPDLSGVTSMNAMFYGASSVNSDLSSWDVSTVTDMSFAFSFATSFNGNISTWNMSSVTDMNAMFQHAESFNQDISSWNVSSVTNFYQVFSGALVFNGNIGGWNVSNGTMMGQMFTNAVQFNQDISAWNVGLVNDMGGMFLGATSFNQNLNSWNVSNVINMTSMFEGATAFNGDISAWNTTSVTNMMTMFSGATAFNRDLSGWNVANVTTMGGMFYNATSFNGNVSNWTITSLSDTYGMFQNAVAFNQDLSAWNTATVTDMSYMFAGATSFTSDLSFWNVSNVSSLAHMFEGATSFNGPLPFWNTFAITDMSYTFSGATSFNRDLSGWNYSNVTNMTGFLDNSGLSTANYDILLTALSSATIQDSVPFGAAGITYCSAGAAVAQIVAAHFWTIIDGGLNCPAPALATFSPLSQATGQSVTINGLNFTGATAVSFGGTAAASFTVDSDTQITAVVATGSSGNVDITGPGGTGTLAGFTFIPPPTITSFTPTSGGQGTTITITGTNLIAVAGVYFGGVNAASYTEIDPTTLNAIVGYGSTGNVSVTTPGGSVALAGFTFIDPPQPMGVVPSSGTTGDVITVTGFNFTGATDVLVGGVSVSSFTVVDANNITAVVALGATGSVDVVTAGGYGYGPDFTYIPVPIVSSFSPGIAASGATVTISGYNFTGTTSVDFGATPAAGYTVVDDNTITATVGTGSSGSISVTNNSGTGTKAGFVFSPPPTLSSFLPVAAGQGTTVTLTGTGFTGATAVTFGGTTATSYTVVSDTQIDAVVSTGTSGSVSVTTPGGSVSRAGFTFIPAPTITSTTPSLGTTGNHITITGTNFTGATVVSFGGTAAASFTVLSASSIDAVLGAGSSGAVSVTTPGGTGTIAGFTFGLPPTITSLTPTSAGAGNTVTITGTNLLGATAVDFGGTPATSFTVNSATSVDAVVATGTSGTVSLTTPFGTATLAGFTFVSAPAMSSFNPTSAGTGTTVTITGLNFTGATAVSFGGTPATSFTVTSATTIDAVVGAGASGSVSVTTPGGSTSLPGFTYIPAPVVSSFLPNNGTSGTTIIITGTGFTGATAVDFGGTPATSFTVVNDNTITAVLGAGTSGSVQVTSAGGSGSLPGFAYGFTPAISGFAPFAAPAGATVTITGLNFTGATAVDFGGTPAASFVVISPNTIDAVVGAGSSGLVSVTTSFGTATLPGFTFLLPPTVTSFTPTAAGTGATVAITGTNFTGATAVSFGGTAATSFTVNSPTSIDAVVGAGASGAVDVTTPAGTASLAGFTFGLIPAITSFTPSTAVNGATVTISGFNFTGATAVDFGGTPATSFVVISANTIDAVVGAGATGAVSVTTPLGTASLGGFTFASVPSITSFTPTSAGTGTTVTLTGFNFTGATAVDFGGTPATSFTVVSANSIDAVVGAGASGAVSVTTPLGTATLAGFTFGIAPSITSFTPTTAISGAIVTITGTNFTGATNVDFGGTPASSFAVISSSTIDAVVAAGSSGSVTVTTPFGSASLAGFTYLQPPTITSFTPLASGAGSLVTITGTNFTGTTSVTFGGTAAVSFTVTSATTIDAVVGAGSTGNVSVSTPDGTASLAGFTFIPAPVITSFTPTTATTGDIVTINGVNFTGATTVSFGGTKASAFLIVSDTRIDAHVDTGASGSVSVTTGGGTGTLPGFTFALIPTITSFDPPNGGDGTVVTIKGTNFTGATAVAFGGTPAKTFKVLSANAIDATVGSGSTGVITVTTPGGVATSASSFSWAAPGIPVVKDGDNNSGNPLNSGDAIDLGKTDKNKDLEKTFSIDNQGAAALTINTITVSNPKFSIVSKPTTIAAGSFGTLVLRLDATLPGVYQSQVVIDFGTGTFTLDVTGTVDETDILVYNGVTPNGDGANDYLKIYNIERYPGSSVTIVNRWGDEVFSVGDYSNTDPDKRFEGRSNKGSGHNLTDGTYFYVIGLSNGQKFTGFIHLQR